MSVSMDEKGRLLRKEGLLGEGSLRNHKSWTGRLNVHIDLHDLRFVSFGIWREELYLVMPRRL